MHVPQLVQVMAMFAVADATRAEERQTNEKELPARANLFLAPSPLSMLVDQINKRHVLIWALSGR